MGSGAGGAAGPRSGLSYRQAVRVQTPFETAQLVPSASSVQVVIPWRLPQLRFWHLWGFAASAVATEKFESAERYGECVDALIA